VARRASVLGVLVAVVLAGCGVGGSAQDRDRALADTCLSTIVRAGLPAPTADQIAPERFAAERRRLVATGRRFNTVTPYKNVCTEIKEELQAAVRKAEQEPVATSGITADSADTGAP
jgi:hypothetical protein